MTKSKISRSTRSRRAKRLPPAPPVRHAIEPTLDRHTAHVLNVLTRWCEQEPGRRFTLIRTPEGWTANLDERRSSTGATPLDALSQIGVIAAFETPAPDEVRS